MRGRDPKVDQLLRALRAEETPSAARIAAGQTRIEAAVAGSVGVGGTVIGIAVTVGVALLVAAAVTIGAPEDPLAAAQSGIGGHAGPLGEVKVPAEVAPIVPALTPAPPPVQDPEPTAEPKTSRVPKKPDPGDLEAELALLREASKALAQGRTARVLELVRAHKQQFPRGHLADERELLRAEAQCRAGDAKAARKTADAVLARRPNSHLADRLRHVCGN